MLQAIASSFTSQYHLEPAADGLNTVNLMGEMQLSQLTAQRQERFFNLFINEGEKYVWQQSLTTTGNVCELQYYKPASFSSTQGPFEGLKGNCHL